MRKNRKPTIKKICLYTHRKRELNRLMVLRSAEKDDSKNNEIEDLKSKINYFEYGIR